MMGRKLLDKTEAKWVAKLDGVLGGENVLSDRHRESVTATGIHSDGEVYPFDFQEVAIFRISDS